MFYLRNFARAPLKTGGGICAWRALTKVLGPPDVQRNAAAGGGGGARGNGAPNR